MIGTRQIRLVLEGLKLTLAYPFLAFCSQQWRPSKLERGFSVHLASSQGAGRIPLVDVCHEVDRCKLEKLPI